jgi:hypothetical protein
MRFIFYCIFLLLLLLNNTFFLSDGKSTQVQSENIITFIPTKEACGAAINEKNIATYKNINDAFNCMLAGYKNVYWGDEKELEELSSGSKKLLDDKLIKKIILPARILQSSRQIIFYTTHGEQNARLLAQLMKEHIQKIKPLEKKLQFIAMRIFLDFIESLHKDGLGVLKSTIKQAKLFEPEITIIMKKIETLEQSKNNYLNGILLGYDKKDIHYFYKKNKIETFKQDKQVAKKWIFEHSKK